MRTNFDRSSTSRRGQSLRWTLFFDDCLRVLQDRGEFESDEILVQMVKFRLISERVIDSPCLGVFGGGLSENLPATFYIKSFKSDLDRTVATIPSRLLDNSKPISMKRPCLN